MQYVADQVKKTNLKKEAMKGMRLLKLKNLQYSKLNEFASNYYNLGVKKKAMEMCKRFKLYNQGLA